MSKLRFDAIEAAFKKHAMLHGPLLHACSYSVGDLGVELLAIVNTVQEGPEGLGIEILLHLLAIEDQLTEII